LKRQLEATISAAAVLFERGFRDFQNFIDEAEN